MCKMLPDEPMQRFQWLRAMQVGSFDYLMEYFLSARLEYPLKVVPRSAEAVESRLTYPRRLRQLLQSRSRAIYHGRSQRLDESFVTGSRRHLQPNTHTKGYGTLKKILVHLSHY
ncbi:hypothetical protein D9M68_559950 [compost metagenome]